VTEGEKIRAGKAAIATFLGQFGEQIDEHQMIVLEIVLQEIMNENMALSCSAGQEGS
jgi:hypothetical protein